MEDAIDILETRSPPIVKNLGNIRIGEGLDQEKQEIYAQIANDCFNDMKLCLPSAAIPTEPTILVIENGWYRNSVYLGRINGKHYIKVPAPLQHLDNEGVKAQTKYMMAHEWFHQRTAELIGLKNMLGIDPDEQAKASSSEPQTEQEAVAYLQSLTYSGSPLSYILLEGIAVTGELILLNKWIDQARLNKNVKQEKAFTKLKKERLRLVKEGDGYAKEKWSETDRYKNCYDPYTLGILKFVKPLYDRFGLENMLELFQSIDFEKCLQITDISEIKDILKDPRHIPGLENSPLIISSFTTEQDIKEKIAA